MKKSLQSLVLLLAMMMPAAAAASTAVGDVNNDGYVTMDDLAAVINYLVTNDATGINLTNADTNQSGTVNMDDLTTMINYMVTSAWPWDDPGTITITVNGVSFNMVAVQGGTFLMGGAIVLGDESQDNELPAHQVTLSSYSIGKTEVTQELWIAVMGSNPSWFTSYLNRPVEMVSWDDCQEFITRLNQMTGMHFRLPTEAEWEFAARGGTKSKYYRFAGSNTVDDVAWYNENAYYVGSSSLDYGTHSVATKAPNELGLYDMSGNVEEWLSDYNGPYTEEAQVNPQGPETGTTRIARGGCYSHNWWDLRVFQRHASNPSDKLTFYGMRLAM